MTAGVPRQHEMVMMRRSDRDCQLPDTDWHWLSRVRSPIAADLQLRSLALYRKHWTARGMECCVRQRQTGRRLSASVFALLEHHFNRATHSIVRSLLRQRVRLSICLSHASIVSKRLNLSYFFRPSGSPIILVLSDPCADT